MKKLKMFAFALLSVAMFAACSDDDDDKLKAEDAIVGKWKMTAATVDPSITVTEDEKEKEVTNVFDTYTDAQKVQITEFTDSKVLKFVDDKATTALNEGTYAIKGNVLTITFTENEVTSNSVYAILSYDANKVVMTQIIEVDVEDENKETKKVKYTYTYTYTKVK